MTPPELRDDACDGAVPVSGAAGAASGPGDALRDQVHVALAADLSAPGQARRAVRSTLAQWRLLSLVDVVTLVVSELVTNAVRHGVPPVRLVLSLSSRDLRVDVHDENKIEPAAQQADDAAESGRGLAIVHAVARSSGFEQVADDGKIAYATFDMPPAS